MREPSCYAAALILEDHRLEGKLLVHLQQIPNPSHGELLAKHILENADKWKESELYKS